MKTVLAVCLLLAPAWGQRYVNPLPIEGSRSIADPAVILFKGKYYLFLTGGLLWTSTDLVNWERHPVSLPNGRRVAAPHAFEHKDFVYLAGNDTGFFKARDPLGPWEYAGDITDLEGKKQLLFDVTTFTDDDGRLYLYYSGRRTDGIYGVELNGADVTKFAGKPVKLWTFDPSHVWERYGDNNEGDQLSWLEAPWMTKRNGTYYLQYSAPGTEWKTYAVGVYTSRRPLGPYRYAARNPALVHRNGLINGVGHHTVIQGPDGNLWAIYTVLYRNWGVFDRRIGMDPVGFDKAGNLYVNGPTETPQWAPGRQRKPWASNDSGSIAVSTNRYTWSASSAAPGRDPQYAFDNNVRTWWEPADTDRQPWLELDLGCRNPADANQEFLIDSARLLFDAVPHPGPGDLAIEGHGRWYAREAMGGRPGAYQYKLEASLDNKTFQTVVDKTANTRANNVEFDDFKPVRARWVRLTVTGAPAETRWGLLDFTVFGKSAGR
ncbi:MAG: family 43 glycosylhydrolase [Bryobacteraceae bacterium]